jgi:hypothetical protein
LLSFFRVNARYQTISLVVFFLLLRLPFFLGGAPLLIPELSWMLVGEQMGRGFMLYRDVWDNVSPFSGLTYWLIDSIFGRTQWVYQLAAMAVSIIQLLYFNYVIHSREVFPERTFLPGALYALFLNISFDMGTLSPMLLATTFLLFAFGNGTLVHCGGIYHSSYAVSGADAVCHFRPSRCLLRNALLSEFQKEQLGR